MPVPDITALSLDELPQLIQQANARFYELQAQQQDEVESRKGDAAQAVAAIAALLGPATGPASTSNIRGVLRYTDAQMAQNAGLAFRLAFTGLEQLALIVQNLAHIAADTRAR